MAKNESEAIKDFFKAVLGDRDTIEKQIQDLADEIHSAIKRHDIESVANRAAEIIANCGSLMSLENMLEGIMHANASGKLN